MAHEVDKEALSAYLDGELAVERARELEAHLQSCADCTSYLRRIGAASADFKAQGRADSAPPRRDAWRLVGTTLAFAALAAFTMLLGGVALKKTMPGLFAQIQGMISGAANTMGSGR